MDYAFLPFRSYLTTADDRPDIRVALMSRESRVGNSGISNLKLLDAVANALRDLPWRFLVDHCHEQNGDLHLSVMAMDMGRELDKGDTLTAGFFLKNSESGNFPTLACSRVFRVVCENGAIADWEKGKSFEISAAGSPPSNWQCKISQVVNASFDAQGLDMDLARFRATVNQMVVTPYEFLCHLTAQTLIDEERAGRYPSSVH
jgi:hypothetical protein